MANHHATAAPRPRDPALVPCLAGAATRSIDGSSTAVPEVLVGDLGAALPLVTRLKATGVKVAVIGPASNPDDVRRAVNEFVDLASLSETAMRIAGRHRA